VKEKKLDENKLFAALKLIEQLNHDGYLPDFIFENILKEYSDVVDITQFKIQNNKNRGS
jgi:hypothetical protein